MEDRIEIRLVHKSVHMFIVTHLEKVPVFRASHFWASLSFLESSRGGPGERRRNRKMCHLVAIALINKTPYAQVAQDSEDRAKQTGLCRIHMALR